MISLDWKERKNLTMLADFYEFTMANGYLENNMENQIGYFDMFFRSIPDDGGFAIMAGVEQLIEYLRNLKFNEEDIAYFESKKIFGEKFLNYLRNFKFKCDVWAIPEGTPIFPQEPIVIVRGPVVQAQLIETMVLLTINHQSLIATKANRIVRAANGRTVMEFGSRRAQGYEGAILGARAAYIGGCIGTANTIVDRDFNIPALGTMAHSWVQMFPTELDAFRAYAKIYPDNCTLLVDTYNTLKEGIPNAITVFNEEIVPLGFRPKGIRIDSGDIAYLSKEARKMLDEAGFPDCMIVASSSLDEYVIRDLLIQGAQIDSFGVGERLITAKSQPVFGGVYKLTTIEKDGKLIPTIKVSENVGKITTPGFKQVYRLFDKATNKAIADVITLHDEIIDDTKPYEIFHPLYTWKRKTLENFYSKKLLVKIFEDGHCIYENPTIHEIKSYCKDQLDLMWDEVKRFERPHRYFVDLSQKLWNIKDELLKKHK
ncbi:nicotinate phosphoribosyltransferase [Tissierella praeacuta DSM 18095]|uniref:Nicotinate phosphoribosyltransferase n=1 Tax=Tissierella praeacuta DSM 18095 TaxID=1123404 RepID=A0A1M4VQ78_9FIRM|nr:nicotinate phosphoribosyltransferase [Tissierella praeacuta]TCU79376.1 nicotinate phosphoribosyltransferase [Tissierella praeacuta]SHE71119.1 nicotinate phosphoribosyltransferase [Tissierella praeacuta DSM 18095]SUO98971.1 Nicotinate phosphoribosyltransferase 2 [Tissierella praeacuta]